MTYVLAIDQSTSATKAVLFDGNGCVVDRESRDHCQIYPRPGWVEHDAEKIWQNVIAVIRAVYERNRTTVDEAIALAVTNQRETVVAFEAGSGRPLCNAIVWQCRRGESICAELDAGDKGVMIRDRTGLKVDPYFSGSKVKWLMQSHAKLRHAVESGAAFIGTIDTYLIYRLTRGDVFAADATNASRTLLYDIGRLCWDAEFCDCFDVLPRTLAEVRESFATFGETNVDGALARPLPVCGVMGDSQASLFAQCCFEQGMAKATFGSGTSVLLNTGDRRQTNGHGAVTALAWIWQGSPVYAMEGLISYSSATIDWLKSQLSLINESSETEALARSVEDNAGVYLVPAFAGLSAPHWRPKARAAIVGMTSYTQREHIVRAALEAIAYQIRDVLDMMQLESGVRPRSLFADGGPTRNAFLMQFTADITQLELVVSDVSEASARGAAMAAMLGRGCVKSPKELTSLQGSPRTYRPTMDASRAEELHSGWQQAVERVL